MKPVFNAVTALAAGAFVISFSSVLVKIADVHPTVSAFYRTFFGGVVLLGFCIFRKEFRRRSVKKQALAILCGVVFALDLWAWHHSIHLVGPGLATILGNFQVFILTLAGFLIYKEKIGTKFLLALPLAFIGLFAIIGLDTGAVNHDYAAGIIYGLMTAFFYSIYLLLLRHVQSDDSGFSFFYYLMVVSLVCASCLGVNIGISSLTFRIPDPVSLAALVTLGVFPQAIAWVMISNALPKVKASHAGLILLLQPALSFVWDVLFFSRPTTFVAWAGVGVVLSAIYMGMDKKKEHS